MLDRAISTYFYKMSDFIYFIWIYPILSANNKCESFPGLNAIRDQYASWNWCYGKTPKFDITKSFQIPDGLLSEQGTSGEVKISMTVENGKITDIIICLPPSMANEGLETEGSVITRLIGQRFSENTLYTLERLLSAMKSDTDRFVTECLKQVMISA